MSNKYSFLMTVYHKENPSFFSKAIKSLLNQTLKPNEIIIICDGPLTNELDNVIETYKSNTSIIKIIRLKENLGLGNALKEGLKYCSNDYILRADSDDISYDSRAFEQIIYLEKGFDIVGAGVSQFNDDINKINCVRLPPQTKKEIIKFSKKRSPFNHPAVAFKKSQILKAGGYMDLKYMEDYYLWIRCLKLDLNVINIQKPLVYMRSGESMYKRRGGKDYSNSYKKLFKYMLKIKWINHFQYIRNLIYYFIYSHVNPKFKQYLSIKFLRHKN